MTEDQSSSDIRSSSVSWVMPALATSTSTGPCASSTCANAASTCSGSVTSQRTSRVPSGAPPLRVVTATLSPWRHERLRDRPADPPVAAGDEHRPALGSRSPPSPRATLSTTGEYAETGPTSAASAPPGAAPTMPGARSDRSPAYIASHQRTPPAMNVVEVEPTAGAVEHREVGEPDPEVEVRLALEVLEQGEVVAAGAGQDDVEAEPSPPARPAPVVGVHELPAVDRRTAVAAQQLAQPIGVERQRGGVSVVPAAGAVGRHHARDTRSAAASAAGRPSRRRTRRGTAP